MHKTILLATTFLGILAAPASAAVITRNFDILGSDFVLLGGDGTAVPFPVFSLDVTLSYDPTVNSGQSTTGLTVNSFNLPYAVNYANVGGILILGSDSTSGGCFNPPNSFCVFIGDAGGSNPNLFFVQQSTSSGGYWTAETRLLESAAGVPEPTTWALLIGGFAMLGTAMRRRARRLRVSLNYA